MNFVVLASGRGSNFEALALAMKQGTIPHSSISGVVCNVPDAPVLSLAKRLGVPAQTLDAKALGPVEYEAQLIQAIDSKKPDYILLAGYLKIIGKTILAKWPNRIINIHPSLLPSFKGLHPQRQAIKYGARWTGCTVHVVNEEVDGGAILLQAPVEILDGDTEEMLSKRLLPLEHKTYVEVVRRIATSGGFTIDGRRPIWR